MVQQDLGWILSVTQPNGQEWTVDDEWDALAEEEMLWTPWEPPSVDEHTCVKRTAAMPVMMPPPVTPPEMRGTYAEGGASSRINEAGVPVLPQQPTEQRGESTGAEAAVRPAAQDGKTRERDRETSSRQPAVEKRARMMPEGTAAGSSGGAAARAAPEARGTTRPAEAIDPPIPPKRGRGRPPKYLREDVAGIIDEPDPEVKHDQDAERCAARQEHCEQLRDMDGYVAKFMALTVVVVGCLFWNGLLREIGFGGGRIPWCHGDSIAAVGAAGRIGHKRMKLMEQLRDTDVYVAEAEEEPG